MNRIIFGCALLAGLASTPAMAEGNSYTSKANICVSNANEFRCSHQAWNKPMKIGHSRPDFQMKHGLIQKGESNDGLLYKFQKKNKAVALNEHSEFGYDSTVDVYINDVKTSSAYVYAN